MQPTSSVLTRKIDKNQPLSYLMVRQIWSPLAQSLGICAFCRNPTRQGPLLIRREERLALGTIKDQHKAPTTRFLFVNVVMFGQTTAITLRTGFLNSPPNKKKTS